MEKSKPFVITISRQLGSGGAYIGQQLAKRLGIAYADREIINEAAKKLSLIDQDMELRDEKVSSFWHSFAQSYAFGVPDAYIIPRFITTDSELFAAESEIIEHLAKDHSTVIIGRCGYHILRDHPNHLSVFLHGEKVFRTNRVMEVYKVPFDQADKIITKNDKERSAYIREFTGKDWMDTTQYDLSINTGRIGIEKSIDLIEAFLK